MEYLKSFNKKLLDNVIKSICNEIWFCNDGKVWVITLQNINEFYQFYYMQRNAQR